METKYSDIRPIGLENIDITEGFWYEKQKLVRDVTMWNVYKRFSETGRFEAFEFTWREGMENKPHVYWDSDVAKWIEAAAYLCEKQRDEQMEAIVDRVVDAIERNRMQDGYFNSYFGLIEPENRFTRRGEHELYCAGHLIEAAIAYRRATGKDKLFRLMKDYADLIYRIFVVEKSAGFTTPGHQEIELALVKLYRECGEKKYLELALYFIEERGKVGASSGDETMRYTIQEHLPVRRQSTAEGHAVRACYMYCAIADLAKECADEELAGVAKTLFNNIVRRRMYVTGGIGQTSVGESFMGDYDLPNQTAYTETCANISLALFARRMSLLEPDGVYADTVERVIYNSFISGMSLDGKSFFYTNMQENDRTVRSRRFDSRHTLFRPREERVEVFECSCCPPSIVRTVASVQDFQYSEAEDVVFCHQYFGSKACFDGKRIEMSTSYPYDGAVRISYGGRSGKLALRIPGWCKSYTLSANGKEQDIKPERGYAYIDVSDGSIIELCFDMPVRFVEAHPRVWDDAGRVAIMRGPVVFCMEGVDNYVPLRDIRLDKAENFVLNKDEMLGVPVLHTTGYVRKWNNDELYSEDVSLAKIPVKLIPYFAFANRGATDMVIWTLKK